MKPKDPDLLRRHVVSGLSTVAVAAMGSSAATRQAKAERIVPDAEDLVIEYPRPDHGENSYKGTGRLAGRKALITGGDSGIGRAAAIAFAREGADVAFCYLPEQEPDAREVMKLIRDSGRKAVPLPGDIRNEAFCQKLVRDAVHKLGGLDIVMSNAAKQRSVDTIDDLSSEQFDATFRANVYAMFWIIKAALNHLTAGSAIICAGSVDAHEPSENLLDYAATRAAIMNFMAKQLAPRGIRVNAVAPGPFWTPTRPGGGQTLDKLVGFVEEAPIGRT